MVRLLQNAYWTLSAFGAPYLNTRVRLCMLRSNMYWPNLNNQKPPQAPEEKQNGIKDNNAHINSYLGFIFKKNSLKCIIIVKNGTLDEYINKLVVVRVSFVVRSLLFDIRHSVARFFSFVISSIFIYFANSIYRYKPITAHQLVIGKSGENRQK